MSHNEAELGLFLLAVLVGFAFLIFLLLRIRKSWLKENLKISADEIWGMVSERAEKSNFTKSEILFGIAQDESSTIATVVVKDSKNQIIGKASRLMATRSRTISVNGETFVVEFPLTWSRTAILLPCNGQGVIARYTQTGIFGRHEFDVIGYGKLKSSGPGFSSKRVFDYRLGEKLIGTSQEISSMRKVGRLAAFPLCIPLEVRIFMLVV